MPSASTKQRRPIGRPKKAEHERKLAALHAEVTLAEKHFVREQWKALGLSSEAEYVRLRCLGQPIVVSNSKADARLVHELNRLVLELKAIGNNANQIALNKHTARQERLAWQDVITVINQRVNEITPVLEMVLDDFND